MASPEKQRFLAVYDYGQGGIWVLVSARSAVEISAAFRDLEVIETVPPWMTPEEFARIEEQMSFDVDDIEADDWISRLRRGGD